MEKDPALQKMIVDHVLRRIELTAAEQAHFVSLLKVRKLLPRQYLVQQGDVCRYESYVCQGFLRSFHMDEKGNDHTLHFAMEDWWISDFTSFHLQLPATRSIVALEASVLLQIEKDDLEQLYKDVPVFERFWRILEQKGSIAQDQRILNAISMTGAERYEALITKYPTLEQRMPQRYIASYLGITPVFLSQIRKQLARRP
ncbi:CRP-like cAMP-binding protein [Dyadobacter sp. BE34]|uniref:CRP-like cAMP-binding protein n=1 Tax=Dyadobacter fermentans TaxID=94254 RepID=A0ABU1QWF8_9BACT|nr:MULTISPECIES: Crp/Fnr family transcriptional regulator [Dyadobacter]MDR6805503.1 CRP-like cAMP-binding protein [Dyadobacter fermentans]MDR7042737.1 CRP-like cAMP-binding protein [Dyadobacter sp. BE242]MDR7197049.1 CRP-like cAMP-binding protein [Dyadobacter sp. BE34]MDR7215516.1 CRP-like cAMP-binding protein [Dyadobacter sp. BE31]MDR7263052.1 CRP-like cAMP-binding protein [Dyadobacter sp. BE32]